MTTIQTHLRHTRSETVYGVVALLLVGLLTGCASTPPRADADSRPNVILLLADDLGWNGLSSYGSDLHETPHLDRLARTGVKFTNAYAASTVCSPTRAAILTGKSPARLNVTNWIRGHQFQNPPLLEPDWQKKLPLDETTIAEVLRSRGYATAHLGKWHLGPKENYPKKQGFDVNVGGGHWGSPPGGYFLPNKLPLENVEEGEYLTDHLTDRAVELLNRWQDRPFFMYFSYYLVHTPIQGKQHIANRYRRKVKRLREEQGELTHDNHMYAAMVHTLDQSVGRILATLEELEIKNETLIIFTSDNGGLTRKYGQPTGITDNAPLRRGKGAGYEGGIRVPMIIRWPGHTTSGTVRDELTISMDVTATLLDVTFPSGTTTEQTRAPDGRSLVPLMDGPAPSFDDRTLHWHYPHYHPGGVPEGPFTTVRKGPWKLIRFHQGPRYELYNLEQDLGEQNNRRDARSSRTDRLRKRLQSWKENVHAQPTRPNPNHNPEKSLRGK